MHPGAPTPWFPEFPAAATTVTPDATALFIAVVKLGIAVSQFGCVVARGLVPKLMLITLALLAIAQSIPAMIPETEPLPVESKT